MAVGKKRQRKATVCHACGFGSYSGRVCADCKRFWGGDTVNVLAAVALRKRMDACHTIDDVVAVLSDVIGEDGVIVPDWPGVSLPRMLYQESVCGRDRLRRPPVPL